MKERYEKPEAEIVVFEENDMAATVVCSGMGGDIETVPNLYWPGAGC